MRKWMLLPVFALMGLVSQVNAQGVWKNLAEVSYKISEDQFGELYVPVFSDNIKAESNGTHVRLKDLYSSFPRADELVTFLRVVSERGWIIGN